MRYAYQPSFFETTQNLSASHGARLLKAIEKFQTAVEANQWPNGLGITHVRDAYFEFRVDIHMRVIYRRSGDLVQYVLCGTHDEIRRYLKTL